MGEMESAVSAECIKTRELRGKGSCCPTFNVDGYKRLTRIIASRPPLYGQLPGHVLTTEICSISQCDLLCLACLAPSEFNQSQHH